MSISMPLCHTAVTPLLMHWSYWSLALSHQLRHLSILFLLRSLTASNRFWPSCATWWLVYIVYVQNIIHLVWDQFIKMFEKLVDFQKLLGLQIWNYNTGSFEDVIIPPPHNEVVGGCILVSLRLSVRLSVRPSRIPFPLCSAYSFGWIHFIFIHLIKPLQKVCHV